MPIEKLSPYRVVSEIINQSFLLVDLPPTNDVEGQKMLNNLYLANAMASKANAVKKEATEFFKQRHGDLSKAEKNEQFELDNAAPFILMCKVSNPRKTFNKDEFIKQIAEKFDLSMMELKKIADTAVKESSAPISFEVILGE